VVVAVAILLQLDGAEACRTHVAAEAPVDVDRPLSAIGGAL
jgi:hypothetical protein